MTQLRGIDVSQGKVTVNFSAPKEINDEQVKWAGAMLAVLKLVPPEQRMDVLATVCDAFIRSPELQA